MLPTAEIVALSIESVFFAVHISVVIVVVRQLVSGDRRFTTGFYAIYLLQAVADSVNYVVVCIPRYPYLVVWTSLLSVQCQHDVEGGKVLVTSLLLRRGLNDVKIGATSDMIEATLSKNYESRLRNGQNAVARACNAERFEFLSLLKITEHGRKRVF